jgi:hypothetical protein
MGRRLPKFQTHSIGTLMKHHDGGDFGRRDRVNGLGWTHDLIRG